MGWLQRWFNASPGPDWDFLTDKQGNKFWFIWDDEWVPALEILYKGRRVAQVNLLWEPPVCVLADIVIHNPKLRYQGLGAAMMREVVAHVRAKGMTSIVGKIMPGAGGEPFEYLVEWYQRQGFEVRGSRLFMDLRK